MILPLINVRSMTYAVPHGASGWLCKAKGKQIVVNSFKYLV